MATDPKTLAAALREAVRLEPGERLYGMVDGAQDLALAYEAKLQYGQTILSLFEGDSAESVADVAPYLVPIDPAGGYLENWARRWGKNAGILLTTAADPEQLRAHLRKIFIAQDEKGQDYFFRFYDPRVLCSYLPTCTAEESAGFYGVIHAFLAVDPTGESLLRFSLAPAGLVIRKAEEALPSPPLL